MSPQRIRHLRWIALAIIAVAAILISLGPIDSPNSPTATLPDGFDSTEVAAQRAAGEGEGSSAAVVLYTGLSPETLPQLQGKAEELGGPLIPNEALDAAIVPVEVTSESLTDNVDVVENLRTTAAAGIPGGVTAQVTGPAAIEADLSGVFSGANVTLLAVTAIIVAVLLVATYRSPILWIIPLLVIGLADRLVATTYPRVLDAVGMQWNESTGGILSVLVFGAGTNYALLLISRYRDELTRTESRFTAMSRAWAPTVETIVASAATVALGVLCLLFSQTPTNRALGLSAAFGVGVALFFGAFVLPGILVLFGRWIFWPKAPQVGDTTNHRVFDAVGRFVAARPAAVLGSSLVVLGIMCAGALQITTGLTQSDQFIDTPESITAADDLSGAFPNMSATPAIVLTPDTAAATAALEEAGLSVMDSGDGSLQVSGGGTAEIREALAGTDAKVGGLDAELYDTEQAAADDRMIIFPVVLLLIFISLVVLLRSLVAPVVMTASVLLTNVAALGIGWWVSHYIFGFERFDSTTPLYAFVFLVALGIDYTIFLVTRAREDSADVGTRRGILTALSTTGGVITSAGILLAAVFAALGVLPLVALAQIGIVICLGVLLDTLIVRSLIVPSVVELLGDKFWWPLKPGRR
ncbi:MMPL family transporter [Corynebacterium lipophiloflavum]|uniref:MMPL family transporter n=1 Tax=Corynebacterium lipophiloflavum TaxID=161889 RepID=UPI00058FA397|nr:MMPL family transporter [Corynebacterium lipophiloflavum]